MTILKHKYSDNQDFIKSRLHYILEYFFLPQEYFQINGIKVQPTVI